MPQKEKFDIAVIGGGPAGMMAAGTAAASGAKVILIEKNNQLGKKLLLTGNSRCNITNAEFDLKKLVTHYGPTGKFLFHAFFVFGPKQTIEFFNNLGVETKTEDNNRVFPTSEKALDVLAALTNYLSVQGVTILSNSPITKIVCKKNKIEKIFSDKKEITAAKYIFCTGGASYATTGSTGDGFKWAEKLGHTVQPLSPALVPIKTKEDWTKELFGLVLKSTKICAWQNNKKTLCKQGDILFTHFGISGPTVLDMSREIGDLLPHGAVKLSLDLYPNYTQENIDKQIQNNINRSPKRLTRGLLADFIPQRLIPFFANQVPVDITKPVATITKKGRLSMAALLKNITITATELLGFELAMVTAGGVLLREIDDKTMQSKIIDNLYFAGEIIDIDGQTGGFNLQSCWSTGYLAGKSAAKIK